MDFKQVNQIIDEEKLSEREMTALLVLDRKCKEDEERFYTAKEIGEDEAYFSIQYTYRAGRSAATILAGLRQKNLVESAVVSIDKVPKRVYRINQKGTDKVSSIKRKINISKDELERELMWAKKRVVQIQELLSS
ncbi:MAG TPA: hypothetical protein GXX63_09350 [Tissierellia bacterium]|nr:hypothetical protein [Tissierellia bacterium]